jgi:hypothetical protein
VSTFWTFLRAVWGDGLSGMEALMPDKLKTELDAIFAAHNEKQIQADKSERERKEDAFEQSFYAHQESTIRPTFEAIGEYVTTKGYEYRIDTRPESTDREGRYGAPRVSLRFLLASRPGHHQDHDYPGFMSGATSAIEMGA